MTDETDAEGTIATGTVESPDAADVEGAPAAADRDRPPVPDESGREDPSTGAIGVGIDRLEVDLRDRIAQIDDRLAEIESEAKQNREQLATVEEKLDSDEDLDDDDPSPQELREEYYDLEDEHEELTHARETIARKIEAWGGSTFAIKADPSWGDQLLANDLIRADMQRDGQQDPRAKIGARKARMVQVYVTSTPPDAPDQPKAYPAAVGEYLYQQIDAVTRFGELLGGGSGNSRSSLEAALDGTD